MAKQGRRCKAATAVATVSGNNVPEILSATASENVGRHGNVGDPMDHSRESGDLSAILFQLVLRRAGEAK